MVAMDRLSALNNGDARLKLGAANEQYAAQIRAQQQQQRIQEEVREENQRAASDTVEISSAGLSLLAQFGLDNKD
jgi:hypothetical protein